MKRISLLLIAIVVLLTVVGCGFAPQVRNILQAPERPTSTPERIIVERVVTATPQPTRVVTVAAPAVIEDVPVGILQEESLLVELYRRVSPGVVHIRVAQKVDMSELSPYLQDHPEIPDDLYQGGQGSGFVWDTEGHIVTNQHVVANADIVEVTFLDGVVLEAEVIGIDIQSDIAVIKVDPTQANLTPVELGNSRDVQVGQWGIAIGNPFGQTWTMTRGIVSAIGRTIRGQTQFSIPEVIQTDAAINPGNSGGPLLDSSGRVIGMNTQIISESGSSAGIGFAVPVEQVKKVVPELIESGRYDYAWLGISGRSLLAQDVTELDLPSRQGALVILVSEGSPAEEAGLRGSERIIRIEGVDVPTGGDVIIAVEDTPIHNMDDLIAYLVEEARPDQTVMITVLRDGEELTIPVTLAARPSE
jgi:serine protease Do